MNILDIAKQRFSVRNYLTKEISQETLETILEAAHVAPTAANMQPVKLLVVKSDEAKEKLAKAVAEAETVDVRRADEYTLGTWLQTWYELYAKPHLRFSTAEYYRRGIELHITPRIGDIPLKKLTGRDLQWLYKDLQEHGRLREAQKGKQPGLSDSTIRGIHTMLHNALDRAVKERLILLCCFKMSYISKLTVAAPFNRLCAIWAFQISSLLFKLASSYPLRDWLVILVDNVICHGKVTLVLAPYENV